MLQECLHQDEIEQLFDVKIHSLEDVILYAKKIWDMGIPYVVISLGKDGALLVCEKGIFHGMPPKVEAVNTVGCGDSMVGAFAVAFERSYTEEEALRYAVAVASANAMSPEKRTIWKAGKEIRIQILRRQRSL